MRIICNLILIILLSLGTCAYAKSEFLSADKIDYNETKGYAEATGHVKVMVDQYTIYADKVYYDLKKDEVFGYGNIRAFASKKEVALGETITFDVKAKTAIISSFILYFKSNDSIMAARFAEKLSTNHERLTKASYTACPTCSTKKPLWSIHASQVDVHDDQYKIVYKNALFKVYGVPVAYFPYFSHVMPNAPPQSGVLTPGISNNRLRVPLYWRPKANFDATFTPILGNKQGLVYEGEIRHLLKSGQYRFLGSMTHNKVALSTNTATPNGATSPTGMKNTRIRRYHIASGGKFSTNHYHYGFDFNNVSDRGYLKEYYRRDVPFLVSNMYVYKTEKQNYFEVNNLHLQGLGSSDSNFTDPYVIPEVNFRYVIPFEKLNDTQLSVDNYSAVYTTESLGRISRTALATSLYNSYNLKGQIIAVELYNRSDLYKVQLNGAQTVNHKEFTTGRSIPEARMSWRYPWAGTVGSRTFVIEPIALGAIGRNHVPGTNKFGLVDSSEYDFNDANFYKFNRYDGIDYHEYGKRVTYGMNSTLNIRDGYKIGMFVGQFQKLSQSADQKSDIVGRSYLNLHDTFELYYRFKKSPEKLKSRFDEIGAWYDDGKYTINGGFVSAKDLILPNNQAKLSQIYFDAGYNITEQWNIGGGARFDVTQKHARQLSNTIRVTYKGDCASISTTISRDYTVDSTRDIRKSRGFTFAFGLKTLKM